METIFAFMFGLLIGSFLNVCIYRMPRDISVVTPRSHCPECEKTITWRDNIPLLSYILLKGRCRYCDARIPWRYPIVEFLTGLVFAVSIGAFGVSAIGAKYGLFGALLIALVFSDFETRILPDEFTLGGTVAGVAFSWFVPLVPGLAFFLVRNADDRRILSLVESLLGALLCSGVLWATAEFYYRIRQREGLGLGDVKMMAMVGAFLGLQGALLTLIVGSILGAVVGLIMIYATGKDASTYELPFGTFLGASAGIVAVFGEAVVRWYARAGF